MFVWHIWPCKCITSGNVCAEKIQWGDRVVWWVKAQSVHVGGLGSVASAGRENNGSYQH